MFKAFYPVFLFISMVLTACGGGGGSSDNNPPPPESQPPETSEDAEAPVLTVEYPAYGRAFIAAPLTNYQDDVPILTVRGTVSDNVGVVGILVNGEETSYQGGRPEFEIDVPLSYGENTLNVTAVDSAGNDSDSQEISVISEGLWLGGTGSVVLDKPNNRLLISMHRPISHKIVAVDLDTHEKEVLRFEFTSDELFMPVPYLIDHDPANSRLLFVDDGGVLSWLDMDDGAKTSIAHLDQNDIAQIYSIDHDSSNEMVYFYANYSNGSQENAVFRVDLNTGTRELISSESVGSGADLFYGLGDIKYDEVYGRLFVAFAGDLIEIDVATGERTLISGHDRGEGPIFNDPYRRMELDVSNNRALLGAQIIPGDYLTYAVDLTTGDRTVVADDSESLSGPSFGIPVTGTSIDTQSQTLYAVSDKMKSPVALDLQTGKRELLAPTLGNGPKLQYPSRGFVDSEAGLIYVPEVKGGTISTVDLVTGDRSTVSGGGVGSGPSLQVPASAVLANGFLYVTDSSAKAVFKVDPVSGNRTVLSDENNGEGINFERPFDIAYDLTANRVLVVDARLDAVVGVDLANGDREILLEGMGPGFSMNSEPLTLSSRTEGDLLLIGGNTVEESSQNGALTRCELPAFSCSPIIDYNRAGDLGINSIEELALMNNDTEVVFADPYIGPLKIYNIESDSLRQIHDELWRPTRIDIGALERSDRDNHLFFWDQVTGALGDLTFYTDRDGDPQVHMAITSQ